MNLIISLNRFKSYNMVYVDFKLFLLEGKMFNFSENTSEAETIDMLGQPSDVEDYGKRGKFLHYDDLRLSISHNDQLEYVDYFFMNTDLSIKIELDEQSFLINKNFRVPQMLEFLNLHRLKWDIPYNLSRQDYLLIEVENGIRVYYYYPTEELERISKFW